MKYKIKVEVMQDGSSRYYPMVKKHWWSLWEYISFSGATTTLRKSISYHDDLEEAKRVIQKHHELYLHMTLGHTYEIPYKEE